MSSFPSSCSSGMPSLASNTDEEVEQTVVGLGDDTVRFSMPGNRVPDDLVLLVWQGTIVKAEELAQASEFLKSELDLSTDPELFGCVETLPGDKPGDEGGRCDFFFGIHSSDMSRAAVRRLRFADIKWVMDVNPGIYPRAVRTLFA